MISIGEALVSQLAERGVDTVFGIPDVHTVAEGTLFISFGFFVQITCFII